MTKRKPVDGRQYRKSKIVGHENAVALARAGLALERQGMSAAHAADILETYRHLYSWSRNVVILYDERERLKEADRKLVNDAYLLVQDNRVRQGFNLVRSISDRFFGTRRDSIVNRREVSIDRFRASVGVIASACNAGGMITPPYLPIEAAIECHEMLRKALGELAKLTKAVKEYTDVKITTPRKNRVRRSGEPDNQVPESATCAD